MTAAHAVGSAAVFVWLGMVLAFSFLESTLKFRETGVTLQLGLGIGRLVFTALNRVEVVLALVAVGAVLIEPGIAVAGLAVAIVALAVQLFAVRPRLNRRSDAVLAGEEGPRSQAHLVYIGLEVVKVLGLLAAGVLLLIG